MAIPSWVLWFVPAMVVGLGVRRASQYWQMWVVGLLTVGSSLVWLWLAGMKVEEYIPLITTAAIGGFFLPDAGRAMSSMLERPRTWLWLSGIGLIVWAQYSAQGQQVLVSIVSILIMLWIMRAMVRGAFGGGRGEKKKK